MEKFKVGDWIIFNETLRSQSYSGDFQTIELKLRHNQTYNPIIQYGGYTDDSVYTETYQFIVITYGKPYQIIETKDNKISDGYSFYFINEFGVRIYIPMTEGKQAYVKLHKNN